MSRMTSSADEAVGWLSQLYSQCEPTEWINVFAESPSGVASYWAQFSDLTVLHQDLETAAKTSNMWFSVATRRQQLPGAQRGGAADCVAIPGLWADVDIATGPGIHQIANLPADLASAKALIDRFPFKPTAVVASGYGLQPWWVFAEPVPADEAVVLLKRWRATLAKIAEQASVHLDDVSDLARMMRLPGTFNRKAGGCVPVTFQAHWDRLYGLSEIEDALEPWQPPEPARDRPRASTEHLAGSKFEAEVSCDDVLALKNCQLVSETASERHYHWPGASSAKSFTLYLGEDGQPAVCWSETARAETGIPLGQPFRAFGLWTWLNFRGDFAAARRHLIEKGWPEAGHAKPKSEPSRAKDLGARPAGTATPEKPAWLWENWLPLGKLTTVDGDPATGKSTMTLDIAARVTRGLPMPDGTPSGAQGAVILLAAEDDLEDTILWRLMAAGADTMQVHYIGGAVDIPDDCGALQALIEQTGARLVIVDVLSEYLNTGLDTYRDHATRHALAPLRQMARDTNVAVLMLRHFTKGDGGKAIHKGGGSIAMVGAARAGWGVGYLEEDEVTRVVAPIKSNMGLKPKAQSFRLMSHDSYPCAWVAWTGPVDVVANDLVNAPSGTSEERQVARSLLERTIEAIELLLPVGRANAILSHDLRQQVMAAVNCSDRTYKSAHSKVHFGKGWRIDLPEGAKGLMVWRPDPRDEEGTS